MSLETNIAAGVAGRTMLYDVVEVRAKPNFRVWLRFADGLEGEADLSDIAGRGVFKRWIDDPAE